MSDKLLRTWTDADFHEMSWHDNHVHGWRIVEGEYGVGTLILDLDHILAWHGGESGQHEFSIAPVTLQFLEVSELDMALNYASVSAGMAPFSLHGIERHVEQRENHQVTLWDVKINWPRGYLRFAASGFVQEQRCPEVRTRAQYLTSHERGDEPYKR